MGRARSLAWFVGLGCAFGLGFWLRAHGIGSQIVIDDEWHAIDKLVNSGYGEIFASFGLADHSIPLTLAYKWFAAHFGLTEVTLRAPQVACGTAAVVLAAFAAHAMLRDRGVTLLFAFLLAAAPFLVFYSRYARPYAITTLLAVVVLAGLWMWRRERGALLGGALCAAVALSAWLHPLAAVFPAAAMLHLLAEDLVERRTPLDRGVLRLVALAAASALGIGLLLYLPLSHDLTSLSAKAGESRPDGYTLSRVISIFFGGLPDPVTLALAVIAAFGAWHAAREQGARGRYLVTLVLVPTAIMVAIGAAWSHQGHTLGRYLFPVQLIVLFWLASGSLALVRRLAGGERPPLEMSAAVVLAAAYLAATPTIRQVTTLGPWYGHMINHLDYVPGHNELALQFTLFEIPAFYRTLGRMPAGSATVIEAPFTAGAPSNTLATSATAHSQRELMGMLHDLCLDGGYQGEVPHDARFRFRSFVFLDDPIAVRRSGARYILLYLNQKHGAPFPESDRCLAALTGLYGKPVSNDGRLAVFDLRAAIQ